MRRSLLAGMTVLTLAVALPASAADVSDTDRQVAQSLFDQARALLEAGRVGEACPKFAESQRLDPGGGTLLNLALCLEMSGRSGSAWARYQEALALAVRDGRKDREEFAREHLRGLAPKLVRVVVVVPPAVATKQPVVELDGTRLAEQAWGTPIAIDPGPHVVASQSAGLARWESRLDAAQEGHTYRVEIGSGATATVIPRDAEAPVMRSTRSTAFWILLGGAGGALAASAIFGAMALSADSDAQDGCVESRAFCTSAARDAADSARTFAWTSTGSMIAGAAAASVAFLLPLQTRTSLALTPTTTGAAFGLRAKF